MKRVRNHPPKPGVVFRVGVSGTRNLLASNTGLDEQIRHVLLLVQREVELIHKESRNGYDPTKPPRLVLICALAAGADQMVARIAADAGYEIQVPLAYPRERYAETNFTSHGKRQELRCFEEFLAKATAVLELDGSDSEEEAYDTAGSVLVSHCDALLAITDGSTDRKRGGTVDSIEKAVEWASLS
jgi:hypothetical protein